MKLIMCKLLLHFVSKFSNINKPLTTFHIILNEIKMPEFTSYKIVVFRLQYIARITVDWKLSSMRFCLCFLWVEKYSWARSKLIYKNVFKQHNVRHATSTLRSAFKNGHRFFRIVRCHHGVMKIHTAICTCKNSVLLWRILLFWSDIFLQNTTVRFVWQLIHFNCFPCLYTIPWSQRGNSGFHFPSKHIV